MASHSGNLIGAPAGGCWFCGYDGDQMEFSCEFDTYFHMDCLMEVLASSDQEHYDQEAEIIGHEFGLK